MTLDGFCYSMVSLYTKLHKTMSVLNYFTSRSWEWTYTNNDLLTTRLSAADRAVSSILWYEQVFSI